MRTPSCRHRSGEPRRVKSSSGDSRAGARGVNARKHRRSYGRHFTARLGRSASERGAGGASGRVLGVDLRRSRRRGRRSRPWLCRPAPRSSATSNSFGGAVRGRRAAAPRRRCGAVAEDGDAAERHFGASRRDRRPARRRPSGGCGPSSGRRRRAPSSPAASWRCAGDAQLRLGVALRAARRAPSRAWSRPRRPARASRASSWVSSPRARPRSAVAPALVASRSHRGCPRAPLASSERGVAGRRLAVDRDAVVALRRRPRAAACAAARGAIAASVDEERQHRGHVRLDHARALGDAGERDARPPIAQLRSDAHFGVEVGRQDRARGVRETLRAQRACAAARMPAAIFAIGSGCPITPVEATSTSSGLQPTATRRERRHRARVAQARARPSPRSSSPLVRDDRARDAARETRSRETVHRRADDRRLRVNTPAALAGPSLAISARSGPRVLMPQRTPAERKPRTGTTRSSSTHRLCHSARAQR